MMRNVAIGAVLGFGLVVLLLSIFNNNTPPQAAAPAEVAAPAAAPAPAPVMQVNTAPVAPVAAPVPIAPLKLDNERRQELMRQMLVERRNGRTAVMQEAVPAAADAGP